MTPKKADREEFELVKLPVAREDVSIGGSRFSQTSDDIGDADESRPIWWATWRSILAEKDKIEITDIAAGLDVFGKYQIVKVSDYTGEPAGQRPSFATWLNIYRGRIGLETFVIYLGGERRWITVSGQYFLDSERSHDPVDISLGLDEQAQVDLVYHVSEKQDQTYDAGYKIGYERGFSHSWVKARDMARKEVWKNAYYQGLEEAQAETKPDGRMKIARMVGAIGFFAGVALSAVAHFIGPIF